ncbi:methane monooxygenase/ammonia monooxygenase subunit B [Nitrosopumilus piranensis]|uniref:Ammonia monooxygenase/particulate methane monooxygenase, subunit B n=1 Tax=Nitrosopumilus piranensis TaxID=1582439 RepID=A0A0C5BXS1_9ARCH|nr:methane monooxygenase/ammonia monooxygenase subunit B [Nitrosopumilus piranensis]AJM93101.1 ammonia monooxygenase/particulate methane monooxygenase, subunit B [Nitrosopumilus piranensis]
MKFVSLQIIILSFGIFFLLSSVFVVIPSADAHDIMYPATSFVRIEDETFDKHRMQTGETLTVTGIIKSNVDKDLKGWISIFSESHGNSSRWEIMARDPPKTVFDVAGNSFVKYSITVKALEPGTYHIHSQFNISQIGPHYGLGQTVVVEGDPIVKPIVFTNIAYELIPLGIGCIIALGIVYYFWKKRK